jgi:FKBP-type peptidyl-prolyl cis-trans isomerase
MEMALGEKSIFTILGHMAYGHRGFPALPEVDSDEPSSSLCS